MKDKKIKNNKYDAVILISANAEWRAIRKLFPDISTHTSPFGAWFTIQNPTYSYSSTSAKESSNLLFFHGGWGKVAAAASTQYAIDHWAPSLLINLGTCGGFKGKIERDAVILVEKTIIYDIIEQMGDFDDHIRHYTTEIDLSWLSEPYPQEVIRALLVSADRDLLVEDIPALTAKYGAIAGDWESGAIAFVAKQNNIPILILRGVTDLVDDSGGEAYGNIKLFEQSAFDVIKILVKNLPEWLKRVNLKN